MTRVQWVQRPRVQWLGAVTELYQPTKTLEDVVPEVRPKFEALMAQASALGLSPKIRSAGRTCAAQQEQVDLGYSQADFCRSMHTLGHAVDLDLLPNTCASHTKLGEWWESQGGVWGGRWKQFGACGDMGHYHFGFNGAGAVPTSVCPSGVTYDQCVKLRQDYLTKAFGQPAIGPGGSRMGLLSGLLIAGVGVAFVWAAMNVKPGGRRLQANPKRLSKRRAVEIGEANASEALDQYTGRDYTSFDHAVSSYRSNVFDTVYEEGGMAASKPPTGGGFAMREVAIIAFENYLIRKGATEDKNGTWHPPR